MSRPLVLGFLWANLAMAGDALDIDVYRNRNLDDEAIISLSGLRLDPTLSVLQVERRLRSSNLFSFVLVEREGDHVSIHVREKTSWFVLPYLTRDAQSLVFGVAGGKVGVFGDYGSFLGRVQGGRANSEISLLLRDEFFLDTRWVLGGGFDYADHQHRVYLERDVQSSYTHHFVGGNVQTGYHVRPSFRIDLDSYVEKHRFTGPTGQLSDGLQVSHRLSVDFGSLYVEEGLARGATARLSFEFPNPVSHFTFVKGTASAQWAVFQHGNLNWIVTPQAGAGGDLPFYQLFELGGTRLRGFPSQQFRDSRYLSIQNDLLLAALDIWRLKLRPLVFLDWALVQGAGRTGLGAGLQLYLRDVAVPAVQLYWGWGFRPSGWTLLAAIGPQF